MKVSIKEAYARMAQIDRKIDSLFFAAGVNAADVPNGKHYQALRGIQHSICEKIGEAMANNKRKIELTF